MKSRPLHTPSKEELDRRKIVGINDETVTDVSSTDFPGHYYGENNSYNKKDFLNSFSVKFHTMEDPYNICFSLIGLDASIANAFRRILIAEIPTLAIEHVFIHNNTSIIQDEVLASRLGLIPLKIDTNFLTNRLRWRKKYVEEEEENESQAWDHNTILLNLNVECTRNENAARNEVDPLKKYHHAHVYAKDIEFKPFGSQTEYFNEDNFVVSTNPDILVAKLRPGQAISLDMHAILGVGSDHAKFSPVATASYRLLPTITITEPITGPAAQKFAKCFPKGVIGVEPITEEDRVKGGYNKEHEIKAVVKDPMKDTVSRECLRHDEFKDKVKLGRVRDHFIFSIESVGQRESDEMFLMATALMKEKCRRLRANLKAMPR